LGSSTEKNRGRRKSAPANAEGGQEGRGRGKKFLRVNGESKGVLSKSLALYKS